MKVIGLAVRERPRAPMQTMEQALVSRKSGLEGDFRGKFTQRQVTLLSESQWNQACKELGIELPWTFRRANILVDDIEFASTMLNSKIRIGDVLLQITEETEPCERMDQQYDGLTAALTPNWRGGVCCTVIEPGEIRLNDSVAFES